EIELASRDLDLHAIEPAAHDALQPVLLRECRLALIVHHEAAALDRGDIFVWMEAERDEIPERADPLAPPRAAERLGGILDHSQRVLPSECVQPVAVDRQSREIHGEKRARRARDRRLDALE